MAGLQKITPHLWYARDAEEAARFYASIFPDSRVDRVTALPAESPSGPAGSVKVVEFTLCGQAFMALAAGPLDPFNHAISFVVQCDDQAEIDRYWEALLHGGRYSAAEQKYSAKALDLLEFFKLDGFADELAKNLPYGSQRRLEIARALATNPHLLLLDEPAAGMKPHAINQLMEFIEWIRKEFDLTILLIEHQMRLVMGICERLKVLDFGATIAEGLPEQIRTNPQVLEAYLGEGGEGLATTTPSFRSKTCMFPTETSKRSRASPSMSKKARLSP